MATRPKNTEQGQLPTGSDADRLDDGHTADREVIDAAAQTKATAMKLSEREAYLKEVARIRALRKPFGTMSLKLSLPKRVGYHRHWFNDVAGRIDEAEANGWKKVTKDGVPVKRVVGTGRDNGALYAFAMEIPTEFWQEDMDARHRIAQERMDDVKRKMPVQAAAGSVRREDADKFYNPTGGDMPAVKVSESLG